MKRDTLKKLIAYWFLNNLDFVEGEDFNKGSYHFEFEAQIKDSGTINITNAVLTEEIVREQ